MVRISRSAADRFEVCEARIALTADAGFDAEHLPPSTTMTAPSVNASGDGRDRIAAVRLRHDLSGAGQTVAIIDSGIAYDHAALGGGFGSSYRVVGGWDFTEDDDDPYDEAPAGFHGTHVAGIVGSSDAQTAGVAPAVDLVALRVFNDQGRGEFDWIHQALVWVHEHRDDFKSPITTVNLSIGSDWELPDSHDWSAIESALRQLVNDGIFISVAAGNDFAERQQTGLSYPAASNNVVPVASVDQGGDLSSFSQRDPRVLAAPGENVRSYGRRLPL